MSDGVFGMAAGYDIGGDGGGQVRCARITGGGSPDTCGLVRCYIGWRSCNAGSVASLVVSETGARPVSPGGRTLHPVMVQLGDALGQCLLDCSPYLWEAQDPQSGSPWDLDRQQPRPPSADPTAPDLSDHPHVAGYWYGVGGADAMLGVRACLSSDAPLSVGALSRVALEAFAWGGRRAWIWEPDLPLDNRIMRGLLCSKHQVEQLIRSYEKHLNANRRQSGTGLLTPMSEAYGDLFVDEFQQWKTRLVADIETVKSLPGSASSESRPTLGEVVTAALDAAFGISGAGEGTYGLHSGLVHLGEVSIGLLLSRDTAFGASRRPNIELAPLTLSIGEAVAVMSLLLHGHAECWGLESPGQRIQPLVDAFVEASRLPKGTLLFTSED